MKLHLSVVAKDPQSEQSWSKQLESAIRGTRGLVDVSIAPAAGPVPLGQIVFVDAATPGLARVLDGINSRGRAVFLIVGENAEIPAPMGEGKVDDFLVAPFRPLEVLGKVRHYQQIMMWDEVTRLNASFSGLIEELRNDLKLAERLQKGRFPTRFPEIKGLEVTTRYLAGMKSGGDYFDLAESSDGGRLSMVLSDSSSYGLSSAVLSVLMKVAVKISAEDSASAAETVKKIREELLLTLKEKDRLSLFYGVLSRKDYVLKYLNLGTTAGFYAAKGKPFKQLSSQGDPIAVETGSKPTLKDGLVQLEPGGRLVLLSDGFVETVGSPDAACGLLNRFTPGEGKDLANELLFGVKSKFSEPDDMPAQDCTVAVFDVDARVIRLAR